MQAFLSTPLPTTSAKRHRPRVTCNARNAAPTYSRRESLRLLALLSLPAMFRAERTQAAVADIKLGDVETNTLNGYSFNTPPAGWTKNTAGLSSFRTATVYVCDADGDSNISVVVTSVPGDFQKLTSFGPRENVLDTIIPRKGKDLDGELISVNMDTKKNAYVIEYTVTSKGVQRHLLTVFSLQPGRQLISLTGQAKADNWGAREAVIRAVADSYVLTPLD